jgi:aerobic carbon-monoxide dehydrogenase medium subunit
VIPPEFRYAAPESLDEAIRLLAVGEGEAKVLAGGQSLLALMKLRLAEPQLLVDLRRIPGLSGIERRNGDFELGASTRHAEVAATSELGIAAQAAGLIADQQVRNRGTIGGTLAHGDPAADMPAVLVAMEGSVVARGPHGEREIVADELFVGDLTTALDPDEVITRVRLPVLSGYGFHYEKFTRRSEDWAMVGVVAVAAVRNGMCEDVRIAFANMASTPLRAPAVEKMLIGKRLDADAIARAAEHAADETEPPEDLNATADYKRHLARVLTRRALAEAVKKAAVNPQVRPSAYREESNLRPGRRTGAVQAGGGGGMQIEQSFDVDAPLDSVWSLLVDVERVAPCLPGAQIIGSSNGLYEGEFHVKVGPASATYRGTVEIESADETSHRLVMKASGKDKHGQGSASATIAVQLSEAHGRTHAGITSTFTITGTLARFGRSGMIEDVAAILLEQFETCVEAKATGKEVTSAGSTLRSGRIAAALIRKRLNHILGRVRARW